MVLTLRTHGLGWAPLQQVGADLLGDLGSLPWAAAIGAVVGLLSALLSAGTFLALLRARVPPRAAGPVSAPTAALPVPVVRWLVGLLTGWFGIGCATVAVLTAAVTLPVLDRPGRHHTTGPRLAVRRRPGAHR